MGNGVRCVCISLATWFALGAPLRAQGTIALSPVYAGASMVSGKAPSTQRPLTVYDLSYPLRTTLGKSQAMDRAGNFAATLNSRVVIGHHIIVVDKNGVTSPEMVVVARPASPVHP